MRRSQGAFLEAEVIVDDREVSVLERISVKQAGTVVYFSDYIVSRSNKRSAGEVLIVV